MDLRRLATLLVCLAAVPLALRIAAIDPRLVWEPQQLLIVAALPWVFAALALGLRAAPVAAALALAADAEDRPAAEREAAGATLRELGGLSVAVGAAVFSLEIVRLLSILAATAGQAAPAETLVGLGNALIGPIYGILLKALIYDPLATAVEPAPGDLAAALGD